MSPYLLLYVFTSEVTRPRFLTILFCGSPLPLRTNLRTHNPLTLDFISPFTTIKDFSPFQNDVSTVNFFPDFHHSLSRSSFLGTLLLYDRKMSFLCRTMYVVLPVSSTRPLPIPCSGYLLFRGLVHP